MVGLLLTHNHNCRCVCTVLPRIWYTGEKFPRQTVTVTLADSHCDTGSGDVLDAGLIGDSFLHSYISLQHLKRSQTPQTQSIEQLFLWCKEAVKCFHNKINHSRVHWDGYSLEIKTGKQHPKTALCKPVLVEIDHQSSVTAGVSATLNAFIDNTSRGSSAAHKKICQGNMSREGACFELPCPSKMPAW